MIGRLIPALVFSAFVVPLIVVPALAQGPQVLACNQHATMVDNLVEKYHETKVGHGMQVNGNLMELYASIETGTWTILTTFPDGTTCIAGAGENWQPAPPEDEAS